MNTGPDHQYQSDIDPEPDVNTGPYYQYQSDIDPVPDVNTGPDHQYQYDIDPEPDVNTGPDHQYQSDIYLELHFHSWVYNDISYVHRHRTISKPPLTYVLFMTTTSVHTNNIYTNEWNTTL